MYMCRCVVWPYVGSRVRGRRGCGTAPPPEAVPGPVLCMCIMCIYVYMYMVVLAVCILQPRRECAPSREPSLGFGNLCFAAFVAVVKRGVLVARKALWRDAS